MTSMQNAGLVQLASSHGVVETLDRLERVLRQRGALVFARIDFSGDAARAGLQMRPEQLLLFGNPKSGTPLMQRTALVGIDLPLKALAWQDEAGHTWLAYNSADYILRRHGLDAVFETNLAAVVPLLELAVGPNPL